jgi:hypothetical protein
VDVDVAAVCLASESFCYIEAGDFDALVGCSFSSADGFPCLLLSEANSSLLLSLFVAMRHALAHTTAVG